MDFSERKTLTIIVPAYNSAATLASCLDSFLDPTILDEIEILIVNDGSSDETAEIARTYEKKHSAFRLINKENGGHGSVINHASQIAKGKYMKVIDSDDHVTNLKPFVEALREANADVVFTNFKTVDINTGNVRFFNMANTNFGKEIAFDEFWLHKKYVHQVCNFHGITYNTDFYLQTRTKLTEHISYEDQEYATLPFANVQTVLPLDITLYEYTIGDANQSVSDKNQVKKIGQLEKVVLRISNNTPATSTAAISDYFAYKQRDILASYYIAALIKNPNKPSGRKLARDINQKLKTSANATYLMCLVFSYLGISGKAYLKLKNSNVFRVFTTQIRGAN